jgi:hypothetical protein
MSNGFVKPNPYLPPFPLPVLNRVISNQAIIDCRIRSFRHSPDTAR